MGSQYEGEIPAAELQRQADEWDDHGPPPDPVLDVPADEGPSTPNLPAEFWQARTALANVRQAAHARARSADAVLGATLARVAALAPPTIKLPAVVGSAATLDLAVALIGRSGAGKTSSNNVAGELVPIVDEDVAVLPLGSGEGLIESYIGMVDEVDDDGKTHKVRRQVMRAVLALLDEGQALADMDKRTGSTVMSTIRSAWSGDRLGQTNASAERRRHLAPGEYRFALLAGFQTEHAAALLDDAAGGTPQRFLFLPAEDPTVPDEAPEWPGSLDWRPPVHQAAPMDIDAAVAAEIRGRNLARTRGEVTIDPLDAHRDLSRLKVAGLLALLDDRLTITAEDWHLAGMVLDTSDRVRSTIQWVAKARARDAERAATDRVVRRSAAVETDAEARALDAMTRAIARHVHRGTCDGGCRRRCASRATTGKHRQLVDVDRAIDEAETLRWIVREGETIRPGEARPT